MEKLVIAILEGKKTITLLERVKEGKRHNLYITDDAIPSGKNYSFCTMQGKVQEGKFIDNTGNEFPVLEEGNSMEEVNAKLQEKAEKAKQEKEKAKEEKPTKTPRKPKQEKAEKASAIEAAKAAASEAAANN